MEFEVSSAPLPTKESEEIEYGNEPIVIPACPKCKRTRVTTVTSQETSYITVTVMLFMICIFRALSFLCVPIIAHFFSSVHHKCPHCNVSLGVSTGCTCYPKVQNEVVTLRIGSCAVVMSKKVLYGISLVIGVIGGIYGINRFLEYSGIPDIPEGQPSGFTWEQYAQDCSLKAYLGHPLKAHDQFAKKYHDKTVDWTGILDRVNVGIWGKNVMRIRMPETPDTDKDTIVVGIFDRAMNDVVKEISLGQEINFIGSPLDMSSRRAPAVFYIHHFKPVLSP